MRCVDEAVTQQVIGIDVRRCYSTPDMNPSVPGVSRHRGWPDNCALRRTLGSLVARRKLEWCLFIYIEREREGTLCTCVLVCVEPRVLLVQRRMFDIVDLVPMRMKNRI